MNEISVLTAPRPLCKKWTELRSGRWSKESFGGSKFYSHTTRQISSLEELAHLLKQLSHDSHACLVRGHLAENRNPTYVQRNTVKHHGAEGFFEETDGQWFQADIDEGELPEVISYNDPEALLKAAIWVRDQFLGQKAPELVGVSCVAQWSASAAFSPASTSGKEYKLDQIRIPKLHLWFWLDRPVCGPSLRPYLKRIGADDRVAVCVQPNYTAAPMLFDRWGQRVPDPLAWRTRILPGTHDTVCAPPCLVDLKTWQEQIELERARLEHEQKELRKQAKKHSANNLSRESAEACLEAALEKIYTCPKGNRHDTVYGQSYWLGRLVGGSNGLSRHLVESQLEACVRAVFGNDRSLQTELRAVREGLNAGEKDPFYLRRKPAYESADDLQPANAVFDDMGSLRRQLLEELKLSLHLKGTSVLVSPLGSGKTTIAAELVTKELMAESIATELKEAKKPRTFLVALPTIKTREEVAALFRRLGVFPRVHEGRNEENCATLEKYIHSSHLTPGGGTRWCQGVCSHHPNQGGSCPFVSFSLHKAQLHLCTHEMAKSVAEELKPDVLLWDEAAQEKSHEINPIELGYSMGKGEIKGEGAHRLLSLVAESAGRRVGSKEMLGILSALEVQLEREHREEQFRTIESLGYIPSDELRPMSWRALEILRDTKFSGGAGCYAHKGKLHLPARSLVPEDIPTRLILDATATPYAAKALYGEHRWRCLKLRPNPYVTHLHIRVNGGVQVRKADGSWKNKGAKAIWEALRKEHPEALHISFKRWQDYDPPMKHSTYYGSPEARGSNKWREISTVVAWDP